MTDTENEVDEKKSKVLKDFKDKKSRYVDYWKPIYKRCEERNRFTALGKQFASGEAKTYGLKKPLEPNLLLTYANHEANKTLQTDYRGKVSPNGGGADEIKARERQDVLRGLQRTNSINQIFNQVRRAQVISGVAYSWAKLDYAGKRGFGKTLTDEFISNYQNVFPDITVESPTMSDMRDCLIRQEVPKAQWKEMTGKDPSDWGSVKKKDLWHYWVREENGDTEYLSENDESVMGSDMEDPEDPQDVKRDEQGQPLSRPITDYSWCWYKIIDEGEELIDSEEWLGSYPPIIACTGRRVVEMGGAEGETKEGKVYYQSLTEFAEEPQKIYTIIENIIMLRLGRSPYSKWKVALESLVTKDMLKLRESSIIGDMDVLYKSFDGEKPIPPPEEMEPKILDAILIQLQQEQERKIQKIFGIFDANLGNKSNEQSGIAIRERAQGGELSNYDLQFNYMEYVEQVCRVKLDLIPKYMTAPQQMAFVDADDQAVMKWVNVTGGVQFSPNEEYSLSVEALPIGKTAREDEAQALTDMFKMSPILQQNAKATAILLKAQPGRYAQQIGDIIAQDDPAMKKAQQTIQQLQGELQKTAAQAQAKQAQDANTIGMLKSSAQMLKSQMTLMKQQHQIEGQTTEAKAAYDQLISQGEAKIQELELQVKQYEAESGRITAEANMLKVVGELAKPPEPPTPKPGGALP